MNIGGVVLGVDFGTSNTAATLRWPDGRVRSVLFDGSPLLPSAVCVEGDTILVGTDALQASRANPSGAELHPKQRIDDGTVLLGDSEYPIADLIGAVLRRAVQEATRIADQASVKLILTHPASWGPHRRETLLAAAAAAGVPRSELAVEPVAAAGYFVGVAGESLPLGARTLIYDLGAGTFDASVVRRTADGFEVLASEGLIGAGGLDIDAAIVAHLTVVYGGRDGWSRLVEPRSDADRRLNRQLWDDVRLTKEALSRRTSARIALPILDEEAPLGREQLDALARPLLDRTVTACRAALAAAGVGPADLSSVYLVGGASRYPLVSTLLHQALGSAPTAIEQPELAVAEGAVRPAAGAATTGPQSTPERRQSQQARRIVPLAAGLTVVVIAAGMALAMRPSDGDGTTGTPHVIDASVTPSARATPSPTPITGSACLLGRWQEVSYNKPGVDLFGTTVNLTLSGTGGFVSYLPDGKGWTDYRKGPVKSGKAGGKTYQVIHKGTLSWTYQTINAKLSYAPRGATGKTTWRVNGSVRTSAALSQDTEGGPASEYSCTGDELRVVGNSSESIYKRVGPAQPRP
ncbi:hypothetical protein Ais01nite_36880 [Asanoa ishikariensis]|uniref:Hsp70 protein n=1 Tax=Asanoa ishikariensis TaxID=137265 RepID=A0A1H3LSM5_9ACTN|nr:Hsp70 family protein [Asanoa ishikariensis]GIF65653.1 hypothetical protein Ais01nite_36880 [Asanoa ishikariensis]SDY67089.1 Hsp70 protein [Asanoa ishikariensis]